MNSLAKQEEMMVMEEVDQVPLLATKKTECFQGVDEFLVPENENTGVYSQDIMQQENFDEQIDNSQGFGAPEEGQEDFGELGDWQERSASEEDSDLEEPMASETNYFTQNAEITSKQPLLIEVTIGRYFGVVPPLPEEFNQASWSQEGG